MYIFCTNIYRLLFHCIPNDFYTYKKHSSYYISPIYDSNLFIMNIPMNPYTQVRYEELTCRFQGTLHHQVNMTIFFFLAIDAEAWIQSVEIAYNLLFNWKKASSIIILISLPESLLNELLVHSFGSYPVKTCLRRRF